MTSEWVDPYPGFQYLPDEIQVSADHQAEKLQACGIDPAVFGSSVDPSFFIGIAIHAGIRSGISAQGNVNMLQALHQHKPVSLGEELSVSGQITEVQAVPRGRRIYTEVVFTDRNGDAAITANRISLKPSPANHSGGGVRSGGVDGAGEKPPPIVRDISALTRFTSFQLTPERVKTYSSEGNSIHYEQAAAEKAGFRAPLIGGGMGVHYLMAHLWQGGSVEQFSADIYFRRPVFWDEEVTVACDHPTSPDAMALLKPDTQDGVKIGTELKLNRLVRD